jgi:hypothetical protein
MNSYVNITIRPLILCNILLKLPNELQEIIIEYLNNKDILIGNLKYKTRFILFNMYPSLYIKNYEYSELKSSEKIYIINNYNGSKFKKLLTNTDKQEDLKQNYHINDLSESNILVKIKYSNKKSLYGKINLIKENKINNRKLYNKKKKTKQIKYDRLIKYDNIISCDWKYVYSDYIDFLKTINTNTNTNTTDNDYGDYDDDYYDYDNIYDDNDDNNDDYDNDSNIAKLRNRRYFYDYDNDPNITKIRKIRYFIDERFL